MPLLVLGALRVHTCWPSFLEHNWGEMSQKVGVSFL